MRTACRTTWQDIQTFKLTAADTHKERKGGQARPYPHTDRTQDMFHKHRLRVSIRTQLIALVLFVAMFSLLLLAIVTGVYFRKVLTDTRVSKLELVAELKSSQFQQMIESYYYEIYQLCEKQSVQKALSARKAGNTSASAAQDAEGVIEQTLKSSTSLAYARLYDLSFALVSNVSNNEYGHNATDEALASLFILEQNTTTQGPSLPNGLLKNGAFLEGPVSDEENYFISLTLPVYTNESILMPQQFLSGYLTVVLDMETYNGSISSSVKSSEYSSVNYLYPSHPYDNLTHYTGFYYAFDNFYMQKYEVSTDTLFNISDFPPAQDVFKQNKALGTYVNQRNPLGMKVSLGYSSINLGFALWMVTVEQEENDFERPITKLIKIMVGLCIGLAAFMSFVTFPLAHYSVRPILKLQKATEEITDRRGLKRKKKRRRSTPFQRLHTKMKSHDIDEKGADNHSDWGDEHRSQSLSPMSPITPIPPITPDSGNSFSTHNNSARNSWNGSLQNPSSMESFSNSYTGDSRVSHANSPLPSIVETKGVFYDELTELTEAFNAMTLELDRQYSHLEDRVRARTKELEAAKVQADMARQQAEKANEAKTVFIANISHELRTPLNGILGMTSVAMSEKDLDKIQNSLELIFRSGELLLHILIQLLTFSKNQLDKSKLQKKNFLVIEVASQIKSIFGKTAKDQDVNLIISLKPNLIRKLILFGDSNRIIQVVMNLVSNSLKFTPENGTVRVLIQVLGPYDEERSKESNYEKVYIKGLENDAEHYPVPPIFKRDDSTDNSKQTSSDLSSIMSTKSSSTLSTLRSSVYFKSLSSLYKSPDCEIEYFNDDEFAKEDIANIYESHHKSKKCFKFGKDNESSTANWVLRFSVSDTGTGIEQSLQDRIFEAFVQGDQTLSRSHGGTGLGLSICKQFAKMMHGTLTLNSTVGKGSTFTFTVPLPQVGEIIMSDEDFEEYSKDDFNELYNKKKKVTFIDDNTQVVETDVETENSDEGGNGDSKQMILANSYKSTFTGDNRVSQNTKQSENAKEMTVYEKPELITRASTGTAHSYRSKKLELSTESFLPTPEEKNCNLKLLVAEDNSVNQEVVKRMLKLEGINNISLARDGKDAVEFVHECINSRNRPFDMILMDVQMPNMDGLSATRIIRNELGYKGPIVALTAFADISNEKGCIDAGMSGFLSKPISRSLLKSVIRQFCPKIWTESEPDENEKISSDTEQINCSLPTLG